MRKRTRDTGVWAVAASFDHYEQLVDAHRDALRTRAFDPTPYYTGFYASRPLLKSLHLQATQALARCGDLRRHRRWRGAR